MDTTLGPVEDAVRLGESDAPSVDLVGRLVRRSQADRNRRQARWVARLVVLDGLAASIAVLVGFLTRFGLTNPPLGVIDYPILADALVPSWLAAMMLVGSYDPRVMAAGPEQYRRVLNGALWLFAVLAFASFAVRLEISRGYVILSFLCAAMLTIIGRYCARALMHREFAMKGPAHRVLALGSAREVVDLITHLHRSSNVGFRVVAAVTPGEARPALPSDVAWSDHDITEVVQEALLRKVDTIAVAGAHRIVGGSLRRMSWELEDTEIDLVVAPAITDIAGPRIRIRPIEGLPLLCVEKPQFTGVRRAFKATVDRGAAVVLLVLCAPLLVAIALALRWSGSRPVIFGHERVGLHGAQFTILKFRTMINSVDSASTRPLSTPDPLPTGDPSGFSKIDTNDPRVTPMGRFLRRWSLDELPQLWNVVRGDMSLVGPRPLVRGEGERFGSDVRRRLLMKPGMTGLWQVTGRSDLSQEERVRLDLYYIDHWSVGLDFVLLWKTIASVMRGRGAY